ncbi:MAG: NAD(+) synthase, partial [Oscillospiraceae bacterium]
MGWCTYNGDHMSMYGVNAGVPKTLVRHLVKNVADNSDNKTSSVLLRVLDTPVSPELLPPDENGKIQQKTEEHIGPYELHDFFLYHFMRFGTTPEKLKFIAKLAFEEKYSKEEIDKWLELFVKRFFQSQFKRSCLPDGPKVGSVSLSPRGDWRMPSDADAQIFIQSAKS